MLKLYATREPFYQQNYLDVEYIEISQRIGNDLYTTKVITKDSNWIQNPLSPSSSTIKNDLLLVDNGVYQFKIVGYDKLLKRTYTIEKLECSISPYFNITDSSIFKEITYTNGMLKFEFNDPILIYREHDKYISNEYEYYNLKVVHVNNLEIETDISTSEDLNILILDHNINLIKHDEGYDIAPIKVGSATFSVSYLGEQEYIEFVVYEPFFCKNYSMFFDKFGIEALTPKSPLKLLMDNLMEFVDVLWATNEDLKSFQNPSDYKYKFLMNIGQTIGFTEFLGMSTAQGNESYYVELYRLLLKDLFGIMQKRGSQSVYEQFFNAIGYDIDLQEFWFDKRGNLVAISPYSNDESSFNVYTTTGQAAGYNALSDPRSSISLGREFGGKSWYILPRITAKSPSTFTNQLLPVINEYLHFLKPAHISYIGLESIIHITSGPNFYVSKQERDANKNDYMSGERLYQMQNDILTTLLQTIDNANQIDESNIISMQEDDIQNQIDDINEQINNLQDLIDAETDEDIINQLQDLIDKLEEMKGKYEKCVNPIKIARGDYFQPDITPHFSNNARNLLRCINISLDPKFVHKIKNATVIIDNALYMSLQNEIALERSSNKNNEENDVKTLIKNLKDTNYQYSSWYKNYNTRVERKEWNNTIIYEDAGGVSYPKWPFDDVYSFLNMYKYRDKWLPRGGGLCAENLFNLYEVIDISQGILLSETYFTTVIYKKDFISSYNEFLNTLSSAKKKEIEENYSVGYVERYSGSDDNVKIHITSTTREYMDNGIHFDQIANFQERFFVQKTNV